MNTDLVIFDFDGTIADTTEVICKTYSATISELGLGEVDYIRCRSTIGLPLKEGFRALFPKLDESILDECVITYRRKFNLIKDIYPPKLFDGVKDGLIRLHDMGITLAIASSRSGESLIDFCKTFGLYDLFSFILGVEENIKSKPEPDPVLHILDKLSKKSSTTIVVGDMPVDILMGNRANCRTIGVTYGNSDYESLSNVNATYIVDNFLDIFKYIK